VPGIRHAAGTRLEGEGVEVDIEVPFQLLYAQGARSTKPRDSARQRSDDVKRGMRHLAHDNAIWPMIPRDSKSADLAIWVLMMPLTSPARR